MKEILRNEKDYIFEELILIDAHGNEHDISPHVVEFSYEESIFSGIHGTFTMMDTIDYPTLLPMIGEESIRFSFTRPDENAPAGGKLPSIKAELPIYTLYGKDPQGESRKMQTYSMSYISQSAFNSGSERVFRTFVGKKYSDIVEDIYNTYLQYKDKPIEIEPTRRDINFYANGLRPIEIINEIKQKSISDENNGTLYTFYEDRDSFYYMSIPKMFDREVKTTLTYEIKNVSNSNINFEELKKDMYSVEAIERNLEYDVLRDLITGEGVSHLMTINPRTRMFNMQDFNLDNQYNEFKHIDNEKPFTKKSRMFGNPKTNYITMLSFVGEDMSEFISQFETNWHPDLPEEVVQNYISHKAQLTKRTTKISVSGDPRVRAGDVIEFKLPEFLGNTSKEHPEELDRYYQGKYLVASVAHVIKQDTYEMVLELLKDSFHKEILYRDPIELYKNTLKL